MATDFQLPEISEQETALRQLINRTGGFSTRPLYSRYENNSPVSEPSPSPSPVPSPAPAPNPGTNWQGTMEAARQRFTGPLANTLQYTQGQGVVMPSAPRNQAMDFANYQAMQQNKLREEYDRRYRRFTGYGYEYDATAPSFEEFSAMMTPQAEPLDFRPKAQYAGSAYGDGGLLGYTMDPRIENPANSAMSQATVFGGSQKGYWNIGTAENPHWVSQNAFTTGYDDDGVPLSAYGISGSRHAAMLQAGPDKYVIEGLDRNGQRNGQIFEVAGNRAYAESGNTFAPQQDPNASINIIQQTTNPNIGGYVPIEQVPGMAGRLKPGQYNGDIGSLTDGQWALVDADADGVTADELATMGVEAYDPKTGQRLTQVAPGQRVAIVKTAGTAIPGGGSGEQPVPRDENGMLPDAVLQGYASFMNKMNDESRSAYLESAAGKNVVAELQKAGWVVFEDGSVARGDANGNYQMSDGRWSDGKGHYWDPADRQWYNRDGTLYEGSDISDPDTGPVIPEQPAPSAGPVPSPAPTPTPTPSPSPSPSPSPQPGSSFTSTDGGAYQDPIGKATDVDAILANKKVTGLSVKERSTGIKYEGTGALSPYDFPGYIVYVKPKGQDSYTRATAGTKILPGWSIELVKMPDGWLFSYDEGKPTNENGEVDYFAFGGQTGDSMFVTGDPQVPGVPNPEVIDIDWENRKANIIPMNQMHGEMPHYAWGGLFNGGGFDMFKDWWKGWGGGGGGNPPPGDGGGNPPPGDGGTAGDGGGNPPPGDGGGDAPPPGAGGGGGGGGGITGRIPGPINMRLLRFSPAVREQFFRQLDERNGLPYGTSASEFDFFRLKGGSMPGRMRQ